MIGGARGGITSFSEHVYFTVLAVEAYNHRQILCVCVWVGVCVSGVKIGLEAA